MPNKYTRDQKYIRSIVPLILFKYYSPSISNFSYSMSIPKLRNASDWVSRWLRIFQYNSSQLLNTLSRFEYIRGD